MTPSTEEQKDFWPFLLFTIHLGHALLFGHLYPHHRYDTDLIAYFIYFRNWFNQSPALYAVNFFPVPKPLPVFLLGPIGNVNWAFYLSAIASASLGSLVYLIARKFFGRTAGLLFSLVLLLDPMKGILTVESSADLYLGLFFLLTIYLSSINHPLLASGSLLLSALVKPVTLPCTLYFLLDSNIEKRQRWICTVLPLLAIPLTLFVHHAVLGGTTSLARFISEFTSLRDIPALTPGQVPSFVLWTQLVKTRFPLTALWGFLGILLWLTSDRRHLTSPLLLLPLLFLFGYIGLSLSNPYTPFFRFFWSIELWFLGFLSYGIVEGMRRLFPNQELARKGAVCLLLFFLLDDSLKYYFSYRNKFALPFEDGMAFVNNSLQVLEQEKKAAETVLTSLAFVPPVLWALNVYGRTDIVFSVEESSVKAPALKPDWIVYVPTISANPRTQQWVDHLLSEGGYQARFTDGSSVLFHRKPLELQEKSADRWQETQSFNETEHQP